MALALALRIGCFALVAIGLVGLHLARLLGPVGLVLASAGLAASVAGPWLAPLPQRPWARPLLAGAVGVAAAADLAWVAETWLDGFVHLLLLAVVASLATQRGARDTRVVVFLSFFMLVAAAASAFGIGFLFVFVAFLLLAVWLLVLQHAMAETEPSAGRAMVGALPAGSLRELAVLAAAAAGATLVISAALFFVIPRVGLAALPFRGQAGPLVTGFADRVELGAYGQIETDATVAMRVHVPEAMGAVEQLPGLRWRGLVFDEFDGRAWTVGGGERRTLRRGMPGDFRVGRYTGRGRVLWQEIYLEPIGTEVIFAAPRALRVEARALEVGVDDMGSVSIGSPSARLHYGVESELEGAQPPTLPDAWGYARQDARLRRFLQLPDMPGRIPALARTVTAGSRTPYEAALRLTDHLSREFAYTLALERRTSLPPLEEFLFERRAGNCEYFAAALAVMLRSLEIPARVVAGFQRGEWNPYGRYFAVRMRDAHSWVEAYFPTVGWITLDPSPRPAPEDSRGAVALYVDALRMRWYRYVIGWSLRDQVDAVVAARQHTVRLGGRLAGLPGVPALPGGSWALLGGLAAGVLLAMQWRRRRRPRRVPVAVRPPRFYARALRSLARRGLRPSPGETAREFATRVGCAAPAAADPFGEITAAYERVRFGCAALTAEDTRVLERAVAHLPARLRGRETG